MKHNALQTLQDSAKPQWTVEGGTFVDMTFSTLEEGGAESYGPFDTEAAADAVWKARTMARIDRASHRLFVRRTDA